ncbi:hypothetical protein JAAARDRAFT_59630 [Jaapia argillacea MUCL 33604]|uniref:NAD(P)-binding protein n=1 Tax=Jaapia argillacea MUCL 33604 TaxID=933084 RepID=A0A067PLF5_9AGAM|nr:hypothetical protein JAAARDRAFT_59630 [Jaapia argillacea MUCL 33604]
MTSSARLDLDGAHAIVTGGSSGIGLIITKMLLSNKANVTILDVNEPPLASLQSTYPTSRITFHACDVSSYASQLNAFESAFTESSGKLDIVIANAGISAEHRPGQSFTAPPPSFPLSPEAPPPLKTLEVNLVGCLYTVWLGMQFIRRGGRGGSIMCTASNAGIYPFRLAPIYAAAKHGVVGVVRSLGPVLEGEGITINAIAPSIIRTNLAPDPELLKGMIETPQWVLEDAVKELVTNRSLTGKIAEMGPEGENGCLWAEPPEPCNESTRHNFEEFLKFGKA